MKLVVASDIHGSAHWMGRLLDVCSTEGADRLLLLGDLLYHGPRNPLPFGYDPSATSDMLNAHASLITAVKGNCDAEVDEMVLDFALLESALIFNGVRNLVATHGHRFNEQHRPPLGESDVLLFGHTHLHHISADTNQLFINPGSVSLPKGGQENSYLVIDEKEATIKSFGGTVLLTADLQDTLHGPKRVVWTKVSNLGG